MEEMTWKAPPKAVRYKRTSINWANIADALKKNPNEWAIVANDVNPSVVTHIRKGRLKPFAPAGSFEASGQGRNENGYTKELYVRFIGTAEASAEAEETASATPEPEAPAEYRVVNFNEPTEVPQEVPASPANPTDFFNDPEL